MRIAVLGAGAWGTALAIRLCTRHAPCRVVLWGRDAAHLDELAAERTNRRYLPDHPFPDSLRLTSALDAAVEHADLVVIAVPVAGLRGTLHAVAAGGRKPPLIWACKGFEMESARLPHQVVREAYPATPACGVLSGPSFAQEVASGLPTAMTLASFDEGFSQNIAAQLHGARLRVYSSRDVVGVETGGAVKNVISIAAGISDGMGFGHNARAALITRGLAEITRLGLRLGGSMETFLGLAGAGDLILTCTGDLSRNRQVGLALAAGRPLPDILRELGHIAEGVYTARAVARLSRELDVDMPITRAVSGVLHDGVPARLAVEALLSREPKREAC
ncbi:NAD(P)H-dependent glycerol-3-phosphate dehydrogenase [Nitrosovibrio sp. Nv17]|jgi:glycerol-3-phosphate dehydrogenase (NAD(P)+)|uniref:NAD(P)H-dependent glycerol-3-phosphate dehydrogenase n=1 Tax=Nitrosovibrio sp. Nv17 TaxID=1855339 RepID=UPI0009089041|nr:NAD(P)H-dependent glycerol-3-phosphate dehydrogenase [Nitrosovibrio sp. Nv17]SFW25217.1 glycerol 3-phosphate dehydrogenase (NAD(P)+) [Nitrosovibrio sp. Nv17]